MLRLQGRYRDEQPDPSSATTEVSQEQLCSDTTGLDPAVWMGVRKQCLNLLDHMPTNITPEGPFQPTPLCHPTLPLQVLIPPPPGTQRKEKRSEEMLHLLKCGGSLRSWEIRHPVRPLETTGMCLEMNRDSLGLGTAAARWGWKLGHHGMHRDTITLHGATQAWGSTLVALYPHTEGMGFHQALKWFCSSSGCFPVYTGFVPLGRKARDKLPEPH